MDEEGLEVKCKYFDRRHMASLVLKYINSKGRWETDAKQCMCFGAMMQQFGRGVIGACQDRGSRCCLSEYCSCLHNCPLLIRESDPRGSCGSNYRTHRSWIGTERWDLRQSRASAGGSSDLPHLALDSA